MSLYIYQVIFLHKFRILSRLFRNSLTVYLDGKIFGTFFLKIIMTSSVLADDFRKMNGDVVIKI